MLLILQVSDISWIVPYLPYPIFIGILVFIFYNIDKVQRWSAVFAASFAWVSSRAEKASVARDIQGRISEFRQRADYKDSLPYGIKVKWEKGETISELRDGEVVVVLESHKRWTDNFVRALTAYLAIGSVPTVRPYCPPKVLRAVELVTEQRILLSERTDAFPLFEEEVLTPEKKRDLELSALVDKLAAFEAQGVFSRIFLRELVRYGNELQGALPQASDWKPINDLIEMLYRIVTRPPGVDDPTPSSVDSEHMKFTMVLVARFWTIVTKGVDAHVKYARSQGARGFTRFYVWAWDDRRKNGRRVVSKMVASGDFQLEVEETYQAERKGKYNYIAALHSLRPFDEEGSPGSAEEDKTKCVVTLGTGRKALVSAIQRLDSKVEFFDESEIAAALLDVDPDFNTKAYGFSSMNSFLAAYPDVVVRTSSSRAGRHVYEVVIDRTDQTGDGRDSKD